MKAASVLCVLIAALICAPIPAAGQDPVKVAPQAFTERLNNAHVRVLEYTSKPGQKDPMHSHPDIMIYVIQGGKLKSTTPDGKSTVIDFKTGDVMWRDAVTHTGENVGTTEMKALLVEVKHGKKK